LMSIFGTARPLVAARAGRDALRAR
jgi:hypothetical protein